MRICCTLTPARLLVWLAVALAGSTLSARRIGRSERADTRNMISAETGLPGRLRAGKPRTWLGNVDLATARNVLLGGPDEKTDARHPGDCRRPRPGGHQQRGAPRSARDG